ncbi:hypothetical protein O181_111580 [Austropuccinia psidii MF-1]|uniref:Uncharacterized protein n=1 Tax=Austropuccinia psidii MF-1 TaxID=1389203 RepID=A0A9Q3PSM8_9BASI|nr:hypothetical protein [Austropuccinia psidii MF-1]
MGVTRVPRPEFQGVHGTMKNGHGPFPHPDGLGSLRGSRTIKPDLPQCCREGLGDGLGPKLRAIAGFCARSIGEIFGIAVQHFDALNSSSAQFFSHEFQAD